MIQVKEHGNRYRLYKTTCPECKCKFTFSPIDKKRVYMCGGMIDCEYVKCPECGKEITEWEITQIDDDDDDDDDDDPLFRVKFKMNLIKSLAAAKEFNCPEVEQAAKQLLKEEFNIDIKE